MTTQKTDNDIDDALDSTGAVVIGIDTVAIWNPGSDMYEVYVKNTTSTLWECKFTTINLERISE